MLALCGSGSRSAWRCLSRAGQEGCTVPPATQTVLFYLSALTLVPGDCAYGFLPWGMPYSILDPRRRGWDIGMCAGAIKTLLSASLL